MPPELLRIAISPETCDKMIADMIKGGGISPADAPYVMIMLAGRSRTPTELKQSGVNCSVEQYEAIEARLRRDWIWVGQRRSGLVRAGWLDEEHGAFSMILDTGVAKGELRRTYSGSYQSAETTKLVLPKSGKDWRVYDAAIRVLTTYASMSTPDLVTYLRAEGVVVSAVAMCLALRRAEKRELCSKRGRIWHAGPPACYDLLTKEITTMSEVTKHAGWMPPNPGMGTSGGLAPESEALSGSSADSSVVKSAGQTMGSTSMSDSGGSIETRIMETGIDFDYPGSGQGNLEPQGPGTKGA